jgi:hypothetical protein
MAGQRRHNEHARLRRRYVLPKVQKRTERRARRCLFRHLHIAIADGDVSNAKRRPRVGEAGARDQFVGCGQIAPNVAIAEQRPIAGGFSHGRPRPQGRHHIGLGLISEVQHPLPKRVPHSVSRRTDPHTRHWKASAFFVALRQNCEHPAHGGRGASRRSRDTSALAVSGGSTL